MKKAILLLAICAASHFSHAQQIKRFGINAGHNYRRIEHTGFAKYNSVFGTSSLDPFYFVPDESKYNYTINTAQFQFYTRPKKFPCDIILTKTIEQQSANLSYQDYTTDSNNTDKFKFELRAWRVNVGLGFEFRTRVLKSPFSVFIRPEARLAVPIKEKITRIRNHSVHTGGNDQSDNINLDSKMSFQVPISMGWNYDINDKSGIYMNFKWIYFSEDILNVSRVYGFGLSAGVYFNFSNSTSQGEN